MQYLVYIKQGVLAAELSWEGVAILWLARYYAASSSCQLGTQHRNLLLGLVLSSLSSTSVVLIIGWCARDVAGRSWPKLKKYQHRQTTGPTFRCPLCPSVTNSKNGMRRHLRNSHKRTDLLNEELSYKCKHCGDL